MSPIATNLKTVSIENIKLLHSIIFNDEFDRYSHKKIRNCSSLPDTFASTVKKRRCSKMFFGS